MFALLKEAGHYLNTAGRLRYLKNIPWAGRWASCFQPFDLGANWIIIVIVVKSQCGRAAALLANLAFLFLCYGGIGGAWAVEPVISEFTADNKNGLSDEDGDEVDWVEIHNLNPVPLDLTGWYLSDAAALPAKWQFPAVSLNANGYLVVFASGKNRRLAGSALHTDFSLRAAGEQLLLTKPDGITIVSQYSFGPQQQDVSYGTAPLIASTEVLIGPQAPGRALVPSSDSLGTTWTLPGFNDSSWRAGIMDLGYERSTGYENLVGLGVLSEMAEVRASCYLRLAFPAVDPQQVQSLILRMRYDDGFAVYLNGTPLPTASRNTPGTLTFNSAAKADHDDAEAVQYEDISLSQHVGLLNSGGPNVLAIHGLNISPTSSDFLIGPQLTLTRGTYAERFMPQPTPGAPNAAGVAGFVADTRFSIDRGFYTAPMQVAITCATPDAQIRYTRNGDTPAATTGFIYTMPLLIEQTTVLRAAAFRSGWQPSNVDTQTYIFLGDVLAQSADGTAPNGWPVNSVNGQRFDYGMDPEVIAQASQATMRQALLALPTISLVTDLPNLFDPLTGLYVNPLTRGEDVERPVSMEIINDPLNPGPKGFQQNSGLRIRGGFSRDPSNPKHSFRVLFRKSYGKGKMDYPLFGEGLPASFDGIDLRTSQDASWAFLGSPENTFLREEVSRATQVEFAAGSRIRYVHVYLNGQYWGLYNTDERPNKGYGQQYFGGDEDDYDVLKSSGYPGGHTTEASDGTMAPGSAWHRLWIGARTVRAIPSNENYYKLMGRAADGLTPITDPVVLDPVNLADYLLVLFHTGCNDGPVSDFVGASNNWFGLRSRNREEGFRFFVHDFEQSLALEGGNNQRVGNGTGVQPWSDSVPGINLYARSNPEFIHEDLAWNDEYRVLFGDRAHRHLFNNGAMTDQRMLARTDGLAAQIDTAIWAESARWGDAVRAQPFVRQDWLDANDRLRNFIRTGTREGFGTGRRDELVRQLRDYDDGTKPLYPLIDAPVFSQHGGRLPPEGVAITILPGGAESPVIYYTLDGSDPRSPGGAVGPASLIYSGPVRLQGWTVSLKARAKVGSDWSALNEAVFTRTNAAPPLAVTEIHASPAAPNGAESAAGFTDKDDFEFIELMNTGGVPLNFRDISGTRGITFSLADEWLEPGSRAVVVRRPAAFRQRYGPAARIAGSYLGYLDDSSERLVLTAASGVTLVDFRYDVESPWPGGLPGYSLTRRGTGGEAGLAASWRSSLDAGGSPGWSDSSSYAAWKQSTGIVSNNEDTDGDGLPPLVEYASGGSPQQVDSGRQPTVRSVTPAEPTSGLWLVLSYIKQRGADDVSARLRQSTDLVSWQPLPAELISTTSLPDGTERIELRTVPISNERRAFLQLEWLTQP